VSEPAAAASGGESKSEQPCTCNDCEAIRTKQADGKKVSLKEKRILREHAESPVKSGGAGAGAGSSGAGSSEPAKAEANAEPAAAKAVEKAVEKPKTPEELQAEAMANFRWCKTCKVVFAGSGGKFTCPGGHPNFLYTKKLPDSEVAAVRRRPLPRQPAACPRVPSRATQYIGLVCPAG
jgi:hypothetical protein